MKVWCISIVLLILFVHISEVQSLLNDNGQRPKAAASPRTTPPAKNIKKVKKSFPAESLLSPRFYENTCPEAEAIIHRRMRAWINRNPSLAPAIIRLHFHDCAVRVHLFLQPYFHKS